MKGSGITNTKRLVGTALFAALAYVTSFLEFPIFPAAPFLKLDFSAVFIALAAFIFGPLSGVITCFIKELIAWLTKSSTGGIGEIANFTIITGYIILPAVVYLYKKGLLTVIVTLFIGCLIQVALALISNRFIMFPMFFGTEAVTWFSDLWVFVACFNLIKGVAVSVITILLYKRISKFIKSI